MSQINNLNCQILKNNQRKQKQKRTQNGPLLFDDFVFYWVLDGFHKVEILLWSQVKFLFEGAEKVGVV